MKEKHINLTPLPIVFKHILIANIGETFAKFQKKLFYFFYQSSFKFCFQYWILNTKESKIITASEHFIGKHCLCGGQSLPEIVIRKVILSYVHFQRDGTG